LLVIIISTSGKTREIELYRILREKGSEKERQRDGNTDTEKDRENGVKEEDIKLRQ